MASIQPRLYPPRRRAIVGANRRTFSRHGRREVFLFTRAACRCGLGSRIRRISPVILKIARRRYVGRWRRSYRVRETSVRSFVFSSRDLGSTILRGCTHRVNYTFRLLIEYGLPESSIRYGRTSRVADVALHISTHDVRSRRSLKSVSSAFGNPSASATTREEDLRTR